MKKKLIALYDLSNCHNDIDCESHYESFKEDLNYHFKKHKYKKVFVKGKNMIVKIDYMNGNILNFFQYLGGLIAKEVK